MKTIGLIGGMSFESTISYYKIINETVKNHLGGLNSAKILLYSVNFDEIEKYQSNNDWDKSAQLLGDIAVKLQNAGADFIVICTNTMHKVANQIQKRISIPILHIADATLEVLLKDNIKKVALLGTKYTMTQDFYRQKLMEKDLEVIIPNEKDIEIINDVIFKELCQGIISDKSRDEYIRIINSLKEQGAEAVILGCTEIALLIQQEHSCIPVYDTTTIHAVKSAIYAIKS